MSGTWSDAVRDVYERRFGDFLRVATAITGDAEAGRDAVQESFAKALRARGSFRAEGSLDGWLWRTVVHTARNAQRGGRAGSLQTLAGSDVNGSAPDPRVRALVAALPERQRLAVFLRYYADLDYQQIAEALKVRPGTVAATLHSAHVALRRSLEGVRE